MTDDGINEVRNVSLYLLRTVIIEKYGVGINIEELL